MGIGEPNETVGFLYEQDRSLPLLSFHFTYKKTLNVKFNSKTQKCHPWKFRLNIFGFLCPLRRFQWPTVECAMIRGEHIELFL